MEKQTEIVGVPQTDFSIFILNTYGEDRTSSSFQTSCPGYLVTWLPGVSGLKHHQ